jgi:hypothetical protein
MKTSCPAATGNEFIVNVAAYATSGSLAGEVPVVIPPASIDVAVPPLEPFPPEEPGPPLLPLGEAAPPAPWPDISSPQPDIGTMSAIAYTIRISITSPVMRITASHNLPLAENPDTYFGEAFTRCRQSAS